MPNPTHCSWTLPGARAALRLAAVSLLAVLSASRGLAGDAFLTVVASDQTLSLTAEQFRALPHVEATVTDPHQKQEHRYAGVPIRDLLARVGAPLGERLRGQALEAGVVLHSKDGYSTLFALAEFDDAFSDRTILLADAEDGKPLPENAGPLRAVVPGDKRAARWARMVISIEIIRLPATVH